MTTYKEEIGPRPANRPSDFGEAITLPLKHQHGNGIAIFIRPGRADILLSAKVAKLDIQTIITQQEASG